MSCSGVAGALEWSGVHPVQKLWKQGCGPGSSWLSIPSASWGNYSEGPGVASGPRTTGLVLEPAPSEIVKVTHSCPTLWPHELYSPCNFPGKNTGVGSLSFLQGIFPTQGSNPGLPHGRQILSQLSHKGSPRILEWVAYSFSSGSSRPRNQTGVSCIAGRFFTNWAMREALIT